MTLNNRYDFVYLFDVKDGNPNGDPDAGNLPRVDAETGRGLVTDVCLKRKVRNYVGLKHEEKPPYEIYVKEKAVLNLTHKRAYEEYNLKPEEKKLPKNIEDAKKVTGFMCKNFYDIRAFGAVMSTEVNCGQVRGPVQLTFARSVDPVVASEHAITRMAVTNEKDLEKERTMGRKFTIPYGLYRSHGFISAHLANQTGFGENDLELLWEAFCNMFEHDRSAARGEMTARGLYVFKHDSQLGNAHASELFEKIKANLKDGVTAPRDFEDYNISVEGGSMKPGDSRQAAPGVIIIRKC
ncbi:MAG: type I-C CRISPR-associated protein Cas7/Csd2 [Nitrospinae bacterium]|nr:type I-C CRISPR-associated protein Cas7/Csd2 [Nitrospinota bacterium]MBF0634616.1 type I-C CRISPR-associated protein Cas7/Csd2 [Nitrospinota bacterium]